MSMRDKTKPILFEAKCIDARYGYESYYLKTIQGYNIKQTVLHGEVFECFLEDKYNGDFMEVDFKTLVIKE